MPDSVDSPAPLRTSTSPEATTSTSIPNDPDIRASVIWPTSPWCLMPASALLQGRRPDRLGYDRRGLSLEHDRVVINVRHQLRPQLRDAFPPGRDDLGRQQSR